MIEKANYNSYITSCMIFTLDITYSRSLKKVGICSVPRKEFGTDWLRTRSKEVASGAQIKRAHGFLRITMKPPEVCFSVELAFSKVTKSCLFRS